MRPPESEKELVQQALHELQGELQKLYGEYTPVIRVYGSQARGSATIDSDIDILLLYGRAVSPGKEIQPLGPSID